MKRLTLNCIGIRKMRGEEVAFGKLKMPEEPSMIYIFYGSEEAYDKTKATLEDGQFRYVIYTPFATTESTGLPLKPPCQRNALVDGSGYAPCSYYGGAKLK